MPPSLPRNHEINPTCVEQFTSLTIIQKQMLEEMKELKIAIEGNGKPGLKDDMRTLKNAHDGLDRAFAEYLKLRTDDAEEKKTDNKDRDKEFLKWRLGIAAVIIAALVTTALGVFQSYIVAQLVSNIK